MPEKSAFEAAYEAANRLSRSTVLTTPYDDMPDDRILHPSLSSEGGGVPPSRVLPTDDELERFFSNPDSVQRHWSPSDQNPGFAAKTVPTVDEDEACALAEQADRILAALASSQGLNPKPRDPSYLMVGHSETMPDLAIIYRSFEAVLLDSLPIEQIKIGERVLYFTREDETLILWDTAHNYHYVHIWNPDPSQIEIGIIQGENLEQGYIHNGWVFRRN